MWWWSRSRSEFLTPSEVAATFDGGVDALFDPARYVSGFHSGLDALDDLAGGLRPGTVTLLSGGEGVGKTALALAYVRHAALVDGVATAIFSPAVTREHLILRLIAAEARIPLDQFRKHGLDATQREAALEAWGRVSRSPMFIDDSVVDDVRELCRGLWALTRRGKVDFVVVDSLGEGRARGWLGRSTRAAKLLTGVAQELGVAVLALSRPPAGNDRASWEQHADRVMELKPTSRANEVEVVVQRNRFGPTGRAILHFNAEWVAFEEADGGL